MSDEFNPYASPQAIQPSPPPSFERGVVPFVSGHQRAVWTIALFTVVVLSEVSFAVVCVMQNELLADIQRGQKFPPATLQANNSRYAAAATFVTLSLLPTTIVFLMWVHRAYRNLPALGARGSNRRPAGPLDGISCRLPISSNPTKRWPRPGGTAISMRSALLFERSPSRRCSVGGWPSWLETLRPRLWSLFTRSNPDDRLFRIWRARQCGKSSFAR